MALKRILVKDTKWEHYVSPSGYFVGDIKLQKVTSNEYLISIILIENVPMGMAFPKVDKIVKKVSFKEALTTYNLLKKEMLKYK